MILVQLGSMKKISVIINTLNEEKNVAVAINSVKNWAFEVIVCDMNSDDKTREIAQKMGAKVFTHERTGYVEPARNYAISKASGDYILILDADEEIPPVLARELRKRVKESGADYYAIPRKNIVFGKWMKYSRWWPDYNLRFFKKGAVSWGDEIHSIPITMGAGEELPAREELAILHHNYESLEQYLMRLNRYTSIQASELRNKGKSPEWKNMIVKPAGEFLSRYFAGRGYKDGIHGLALSLLQAFSELIVEIKLWELSSFKSKEISLSDTVSEIKGVQREMNYWIADSLVNETGGILNRIKRKLKLP